MKSKKLLQRHKLKPKKSWGQNFLVSKPIIEKIVAALAPTSEDWVLELGAGAGALTEPLCQKAEKVFAIERDPDLIELLQREFGSLPNLEIIPADAASYPLEKIEAPRPLLVAGNLPYQISAPILFHLQKERKYFSRAVLMLQKEVAERLVAKPDAGKDYSILSVIFSTFFKVEKVFNVSKNNFYPRPKVDSAIVKLTVLEKPSAPVDDEKFFIRTVKMAFSQRRKTLYNNIRSSFPNLSRDRILQMLEELEIDSQQRGETLTPHQFALLAQKLKSIRGPANTDSSEI